MNNPKYTRFRDVCRSIYYKNGVNGFYKGLASCLLRAGPSNAAGFWGFEKSMHIL